MNELVVIAHNLRSTHNVGSLLRTAEGLGVRTVYLTGYTPYPLSTSDGRIPHQAGKIDKQIKKTALGAETSQSWQQGDINAVIEDLHDQGFVIAGLDQTPEAINLNEYQPAAKLAIILGREVEGIEKSVLNLTDLQLVIPMFGKKESFNVVQAAAMALYHCRFT